MTMIRRRLFAVLAVSAGAGLSAVAQADGLSSLEAFLRQTQQGQTTFTQTVTAPLKAGETRARNRTSRGVFAFQRPDRFRFEYNQPFEQTIVADGKTLWLYDADLNQVTARAQKDVLGNTPAALIAAAPDLRGLHQVFELRNAPDADGLSWVQASPKSRDGQVQTIRLGFRGNELASLDMLDSFGQRSVISFGAMEAGEVKPAQFRFTPPDGAEVVRQ